MHKLLPSVELLTSLLKVEPTTGEGVWIKSISNRARIGSRIKSPTDILNRYKRVTIYGITYNWHRIVYKMYHGDFDESLFIDHINGNKQDNSLQNLRLVTHAENNRNQKIQKSNTSGHLGVSWQPNRKKWEVYITHNFKLHKLGRYKTLEEAIQVRKEAEIKFNFHPNHGRQHVC